MYVPCRYCFRGMLFICPVAFALYFLRVDVELLSFRVDEGSCDAVCCPLDVERSCVLSLDVLFPDGVSVLLA